MKIISVVFHPLLIATHLTALILFVAPELLPRIQPQVFTDFLFLIFLVTGFLPAFSVFLLRKFKYISDLELSKRGERLIPFIFILFYYAVACYLFYEKLAMGSFFNLVMISVTILIFILIVVTLRFKISIHSAAAWGGVGYVTAILVTNPIEAQWMYFFIVVMAGLTSTSRLYLGYHTPKQIWAGVLLGFIYCLAVVLSFS